MNYVATIVALRAARRKINGHYTGLPPSVDVYVGRTGIPLTKSSLPSSSLHTLSQGSSASGTQPFPPFEVIQIQARIL